MARLISVSKNFSNTTFDTYVPDLSDNANIQNAFELFYYGNSDSGNTYNTTNSIFANLLNFDGRITSATSGLSGHTGGTSNIHGVGAGNSIVGTGTVQNLTNKTINLTDNTLSGTIAQFNTALSNADFATIAGTESLLNKTLTAPILSGTTNATSGTIALGTNASAITANSLTITATQVGYLFGVTSAIQTQFTNQTSALTTHAALTTSAHGIADTSKLARIASAPAGRTIFVQAATPTALAIGDIWFQVTGL